MSIFLNDDIHQCNDKFAVRHRRSSESVVQQVFKHQFLDYEHLFLISDCAGSVLEFVRLVNERPQDVVELINAVYAEFVPDVFL